MWAHHGPPPWGHTIVFPGFRSSWVHALVVVTKLWCGALHPSPDQRRPAQENGDPSGSPGPATQHPLRSPRYVPATYFSRRITNTITSPTICSDSTLILSSVSSLVCHQG